MPGPRGAGLALGMGGRGGGGITPPAPSWSPSDLTNLYSWHRSDSGLWQDSGKTTPVTTDSDPVGAWEPKAGTASIDLLQPTSENKPTYRTGRLNGHPSLSFDGGDYLGAAFAVDLTQPTDVIVVGRSTAASGDVFCDSVNTARHLFWKDNAGDWSMYAGSFITSTPSDTDFHYFVARYNTTSSVLRIDGSEAVSGNAGSQDWGGLRLGAAYNGAGGLSGDILESIVVDGAMSVAELSDLESYLATRYGL